MTRPTLQRSGKGDIRARCAGPSSSSSPQCNRYAVTAYVFRRAGKWTKPYPACLEHRVSDSDAMDWYPDEEMGRVGVDGYILWIQIRRQLSEKDALAQWQQEVPALLTEVWPPRATK